MTDATFSQAVADVVSALVGEPDVTHILAHLVGDCAEVMDADAVAILARDDAGELSLLAATSHRASELEMLQIQRSAGPCVEVLESGRPIRVVGADQLRERWDDVGQAIVDAGFVGVEAYPLRWRGTVLGGLNVFRSSPPVFGWEGRVGAVGQAFADIATLAVAYSMPLATDQVAAHLNEALIARELVEQAKGVIAHVDDVDMGTAYESLLHRADRSGLTLTRVAETVIDEQLRRPRP